MPQANRYAGQRPSLAVHDSPRNRGCRALRQDDLDGLGRRVFLDGNVSNQLRLAIGSDDADGVTGRLGLRGVVTKPQVIGVLPSRVDRPLSVRIRLRKSNWDD